ncbi:MAG: prepilin peptidase [Pseudomonadales bacterium]|jgi:leader peptidase (prepilin peptidase)/N-methyltransferase|nr:prepilin peptidase [Pseudomonadales bacterium]
MQTATLIEFLAANPTLFGTGIAILALLIGSFLNVVILRLPRMMEHTWRREALQLLQSDVSLGGGSGAEALSLAHPPSTCPKCGHLIRPWENIPVISYLFLRGRCAKCREPISARYPLVEAATAVLSVVVALHFGVSWTCVLALLFTWALIALTMIDFDHQLLPDSITLPLLWLGLLVNSFGVLVPLVDAVWGAALGYLSLWSVYWAFRLLTGKEGMGFGDFKLLAALGAWLGWQALPLVIILSSLVGAVIGVVLIVALGRDRNVPIPFGPYLAAAGWITLLWGDAISGVYLSTVAP